MTMDLKKWSKNRISKLLKNNEKCKINEINLQFASAKDKSKIVLTNLHAHKINIKKLRDKIC